MDAIMKLITDFDPAALLPDISTTVGFLELLARLAILAVPVILLILGLIYFFRPPKEANHTFGYRTYFGMGSVEAWRYTQFLAGLVFGILGAVLTVSMLIVGFIISGKEILDLLLAAVTCIFIEILATALASIVINVLVFLKFDRDGYLRGSR